MNYHQSKTKPFNKKFKHIKLSIQKEMINNLSCLWLELAFWQLVRREKLNLTHYEKKQKSPENI